jgi:hypothetical protein
VGGDNHTTQLPHLPLTCKRNTLAHTHYLLGPAVQQTLPDQGAVSAFCKLLQSQQLLLLYRPVKNPGHMPAPTIEQYTTDGRSVAVKKT